MAAYTTIDDPEAYFQVKIWTGTGSSNALTLDGTTDMAPDYVMIKQRSSTQQWNGYDDLRGVQKYLGWNTGILENTQSEGLTAFGSDGFTVGTDDMVNKSSSTYVAYCWKETATAGFDMVLYTGNETARTISHSLSAVPHCMIFKNRDTSGGTNWIMYHHSLGNTYGMVVNETEDKDDQAHYFNDTTPTSSVFTLGDGTQTNTNTEDHIGYLWSEKQGFSKFGTYEGTNNADGTFVFTGFTPAFVMVKNVDEGSGPKWVIQDTKRSPSLGGNPAEARLKPNDNTAEEADSDIDLLSNGFKIRSTGSYTNDAQTYIYVAFAEAPFVNSNGVPCNAV